MLTTLQPLVTAVPPLGSGCSMWAVSSLSLSLFSEPDNSSFCPDSKESRRPLKCRADRDGKGLALCESSYFSFCYALNPFGLVAACTPTVKRGYCVTEQDIVPNHCAWFVGQGEREVRGNKWDKDRKWVQSKWGPALRYDHHSNSF